MTRFWRIEHRDSDNESGRNTGYEGEIDATIVEKDKQIFQVWQNRTYC